MSKKKVELSLLFIVFITLSAGMLLNILFIKSPNDGVYYYQIALNFIDHGILYDPFYYPAKVMSSTQIGSSIILFFFLKISENYWYVFYTIFITSLWYFFFLQFYKLINTIIKFENDENNLNALFLSSVFFLIFFFNIDAILTASSWYNEAVYYPCLLIFFSLIFKKMIEGDKIIFRYNVETIFLIAFLLLGFVFRIQHLTIFPALIAISLYNKQKKDFAIIILIGILISVYFFSLSNYILSDYPVSIDQRAQTTVDIIYSPYKILQPVLKDLYLNLYNVLGVFSSPFNIPRILDFKLSYHLENINLLIPYVLFSSLIFYFFLKTLIEINRKYKNIFIFSVIVVLSNIIFIWLLPDQDTRYYLYSNFIIVFILILKFKNYLNFDYVKKYFLYLTFFFIIFFTTLPWYAYNFWYDKKKSISSRLIINILMEFKDKYNVKEFDLYTSYPREVIWILKKPVNSIPPENYKLIDPKHNNNFVFFGNKNNFDFIMKSMTKKQYKLGANLLNNSKDLSIWLIETND